MLKILRAIEIVAENEPNAVISGDDIDFNKLSDNTLQLLRAFVKNKHITVRASASNDESLGQAEKSVENNTKTEQLADKVEFLHGARFNVPESDSSDGSNDEFEFEEALIESGVVPKPLNVVIELGEIVDTFNRIHLNELSKPSECADFVAADGAGSTDTVAIFSMVNSLVKDFSSISINWEFDGVVGLEIMQSY